MANFIGDVTCSKASVVKIEGAFAEIDVRVAGLALLQGAGAWKDAKADQQKFGWALRPEKIHIDLDKPDGHEQHRSRARSSKSATLGSISHYRVELAIGQRIKALRTNSSAWSIDPSVGRTRSGCSGRPRPASCSPARSENSHAPLARIWVALSVWLS